MATEENVLTFTRQLAGAEDLVFGFGSTSQIREGEYVTLSLINADIIPYDSTRTIKQALDELFANSSAVSS